MLRVHHIGIIVPDADETSAQLQRAFGVAPRPGTDISGGHLKIQFVDLDNCSLEVIQPLDDTLPQGEWLKQHGPGVHHIAFEVDDLTKQIGHFTGLGVLPQDSQPTPGAGPYVLLNLPPAALGGFLSQLIQSTTKEDA